MIKRQSKISCLLSTYNDASYLESTINSLVTQRFKPYEILVIDDGSNDESWELLTAFSKAYKCIKIIRNPKNLGYIANIIRLTNMATGDVVHRGAADDYMHYEYLYEINNMWAKSPNAGVYSTNFFLEAEEVYESNGFQKTPHENTKKSRYLSSGNFANHLLKNDPLSTPCPATCFNRKYLKNGKIWDRKLGIWEVSFAYVFLGLKYGAFFSNKYLYTWNLRKNSWTDQEHGNRLRASVIFKNYRNKLISCLKNEAFKQKYYELWSKNFKDRFLK